MKKLFFLLSITVICSLAFGQERIEKGNLVMENVPEIPLDIKERVAQYQNTRSASLSDWHPSGDGMLISTRFGNVSQLHYLEQPLGARQQITFFDEPVGGGSFCPDKEHNGFLFLKDIGGNEFDQIYWYDFEKAKTTMVSDGESRNLGISWSNSGNQFAFTSTRRTGKTFDVYVSSMNDPQKAELLIDKGNGYWIVSDWSPDDSKLLLLQYISANKSNSFIYDMATKKLEQINNADDKSVFQAVAWDHKGENVYVITDKEGEFNTGYSYNVAKKKFKPITHKIPWNVGGFAMSDDRRKVVFTMNEGGISKLYSLNLENYKYKAIKGLPAGQVYGLNFHPTENKLGMVINSTQSPGDIYVLNMDSGKVKRWTKSEVGGLNTTNFAKPELIEFKTFDERMIPAFMYRPKNETGRKLPVVINIHGGPEGQHRPFFSSFTSFMTNELGIAVIAPNVRGSAGYGKSYLQLDNGYKREESVKDIGALLDWIKAHPNLDENRVAVYGGSYGGYMVLSSMFNYNDRLKCGVDIVGISNFVTFLENTEDYRRDLRRVEYGDERDPEMRAHLEKISPTNHAEKIQKPLFVIQGANDPRVPASESEQMVQKIRDAGGQVWYLLAKDEGHGFAKKENRDFMTNAVALFFTKNLIVPSN